VGNVSEVVPEDEDRGGAEPLGGEDQPKTGLDEEGGTDADDGGPGSQNM
jgi:hypothetical protein